MNIRETIETADPCNVCDLRSPGLRRTCESLGRCDTRDAWARLKQEAARLEAVCEFIDALAVFLKEADDEHTD